jgi:23S rRNA (pseudouridine1915-N3)-methyltransferase
VSPSKARVLEGERLLRAIPARSHVVALAVDGEAWSTPKLASKLTQWTTQGLIICLLIGGADEHWSLSTLTLPHGLVRPVVAEALYRAWSLTQGHPYHR